MPPQPGITSGGSRGVPGRGVDAELVLEVQIRLAQPVVIAKDTAFGHRTVLLSDRE